MLWALLAGGGDARADEEVVGAEVCKACHAEAFETWSKGPHARAAARLSKVQAADPRCQTCHAPLAAEGLGGVQCESCHGAGSAYARSYVMRDTELVRLVGLEDPSPKVCARCHAEAPSLRTFEYEAARARIRHWPEAP